MDEDWTSYTCGSGGCTATATCVLGVEQCIPGSGGLDEDCDLVDDDCDTVPDDDYISYTCGSGSCTATSTCVLGVEDCTPPPGSPDTDCDTVDDDCDTVPDDDYIPTSTCGTGACLRDSTCTGGVESCSAGTPTSDDDCDTIDDDCDGASDEHYAPYQCGNGVCERDSTCIGGTETCSPGAPTGDDSDCDGLDDDCDGSVDEIWVPYTCGVGACERSATCVGGVANCIPGSTTGDDSDCDGVDDDCDTVADNHYSPYTCGVGVCQRSSTCTGGMESCTAGSPTGPDTDCDGVDENCTGGPDDGWTTFSCGLGPCLRWATCISGTESCVPGTGTAESCNGVDDDCDGTTDDGSPTELCGTIPHGTPACTGGTCVIDYCTSGYHDLDGVFGNGCECLEDTYEPAGATCPTAIDLGVLLDSAATFKTVTGNIAPGGDEDWYVITANDDADTTEDEFNLEAYFVTNPGGLVMDIYKGGCGTAHMTGCDACFNWYTDFYDGTDGQAPCGLSTTNPCDDDSDDFYIRVRRASGAASCASYTLRISNNPPTLGPGCDHYDSCGSYTTVTPNNTYSGTMSGEADYFSGSCGGSTGPDKLYRMTLSSAQDVFIAAFSTAFDPVLYLSPTCGSSSTGCNNNAYTGVNSSALVLDNLAAGTYYIIVDSQAATTGAFSLEIYASSNGNAGNSCGGPRRLYNGITGTTSSGMTNTEYPSCCSSSCSAPDSVFYFIKEAAGSISINNCFYTDVWDAVGALRDVCTLDTGELACSDDECGYVAGQPSLSGTLSTPGVYFYVLDGWCSGSGSYNLATTGI
ncbi:MAG: hypothetical protein JRG91_12180 [Deltaproteobacteria bacterium]|nr:hypothetical protein [Deltaproteobacteria bacterium]